MPSLASIVQRAGRTRVFARIGRALMPLDRAVGRLTRGRFVAFGLRALPSMLLTTTGRRSGLPRTNPLLYAPDGDSFLVIGSNWGQHHHPAWSTNLLATPDATVIRAGVEIPVRASLVSGAERERVRGLLVKVWPGYADYEVRSGRQLRIFRLDPR